MLSVRRRPSRWNLPACPRVYSPRTRIFSRSLDEVTLTITHKIAPAHAKPAGFTDVRCSQGSTPTTCTARFFFSYTHFGKLNWRRKVDRNDGCDRCGRPLVVLVTALIGQRLQPLEPNSQSVIFFWRYSNVRHTINKRRASPCSWSQELSSHTKVNEVRQRRPKWRQLKKKKLVSLAGLHHSICKTEIMRINSSLEWH